jgi:pyruvate kinase
MGRYPEEAVAMLARIAAYTETHRTPVRLSDYSAASKPARAAEALAMVVEHALDTVPIAGVFVPTRSGTTARMISRFNPAVWIVGLSRDAAVCQGLAFSYGVHPVHLTGDPENWREFCQRWLQEHQVPGKVAMLVAGPSRYNPDANYRVEFMRVGEKPEKD